MRILLLLALAAGVLCAQTTRDMNEINWMEFRELVPSKVSV